MLAYVTITVSLTDNTGIEYNDTKFSLYENTIFEQCANTTPDSVNCTALFWAAVPEVSDPPGISYTYQPIKGIDSARKSNLGHPTNSHGQKILDWCSLTSCLRDYKIVPRKPYDVAFGYRGYNRLTIWGWVTVSTITGFWFLRNMSKGVHLDSESHLGDYELTTIHHSFGRYHSEGRPSSKRKCKGTDPVTWIF